MTADARSYLVQQTERLRLAVREIRSEFQHLELRMKEVQTDLICVVAAVDDIADEMKKDAAA
jgi:hypothetical protein